MDIGDWQHRIPNIPKGIEKNDPYALFSLFFPEDIWSIIAQNTNAYATLKRAHSKEIKHWPWHATNEWEIKVFMGCLIYMGVHHEPNLNCYWNPHLCKGAVYTIPLYMSQNRFEQLHWYFHISNPDQESDQQFELGPEKDIDNLSTARIENIWWYKIDPLVSRFRDNCKQYWNPGNWVAIDEMMIYCFGWSKHTFKMPGKSIKEEYKLWGLCESGYLYSFMFTTRANGTRELVLEKSLTPTTSMVFQMVQQLPTLSNVTTLFLDNLFTSISFFSKLRSIGISAVGTTRLSTAGKDYLSILHILKEKYGTVSNICDLLKYTNYSIEITLGYLGCYSGTRCSLPWMDQ